MNQTRQKLKSFRREIASLVRSIDLGQVRLYSDIIRRAAQSDGVVYVFGNGGSAALAMHLVADMGQISQTVMGPRTIRVSSLCAEVGALTALANDYRYTEVFSRQLRVLLRKGDVVLGVSTSGQSSNILNAISEAKTHGAICLGLVGARGKKMASMCDYCVTTDSTSPKIIETVQLAFTQLLVEDIFQNVEGTLRFTKRLKKN